LIGQKLGEYEIVAKIGEGGMGEVYRARDPRLDREVAIKVLPEQRLDSPDARTRFEREAKAVAALSHPNILAIYEFGEHEGATYAVTELLEGQSLLDELKLGPVPLRRAVDVAGQIADGLAAAHEKGIVHRDLKPANVFLLPDGRVKILDFGLAKTGPVADLNSATAKLPEGTAPGTVLGTVRYMSPEQVRGEEVDPRSDIFSFGTVLWEMLSGEVAFQRDSAVEIMSAILKEEAPDLASKHDAVPASIDRIVRRCMEKAPERRFQSARDLSFALDNALDSTSRGLPALNEPAAVRRGRAPVLVAAVMLVLGGAGGFFLGQRSAEVTPPVPVKVSALTHSGADWSPSASPDGKMIAFVSNRDGQNRIWLRQMQGGIEVPLTDGPDLNPAFAPDGSSILFLRQEGVMLGLHRVALVGGAPRKLLDNVFEACWGPDGSQIAFIDATEIGGDPVPRLNILDVSSGTSRLIREFPGLFARGMRWSPDGRKIALTTGGTVQNRGNTLQLIDVETGEQTWSRFERKQFAAPAWSADGQTFVVAQSQSLLGDISSAIGEVLHIDPRTDQSRTMFWVQSVWAGSGDFVSFDFLDDRHIVFDEILWRGSLSESALGDGDPKSAARALTSGNSRDRQPAYSPDGTKVVFSSNRSGNTDLWILDLRSGEVRQVTEDQSEDWDPAFSADGESLLWSSNRGGVLEIWTARADGSQARQLSNDGVDAENPTQTPDGQWVVYASANPEQDGVWKMRSDGSDPRLLVSGAYFLPEVSPDGNHVSFVANDPERQQAHLLVARLDDGELVFRTSVPFTGFQPQISPCRSRWTPDGSALYFVAPNEDNFMCLVRQEFRAGEDTDDTRRLVVVPAGDDDIESFGISPDGEAVTYSHISHFRRLKIAEGDFGIGR
jgi:serine/threonine protein kinase